MLDHSWHLVVVVEIVALVAQLALGVVQLADHREGVVVAAGQSIMEHLRLDMGALAVMVRSGLLPGHECACFV